MLDKIKNNCYNHHSEIHKGHEQQSSIYTWSVTATCLRTGPETLDGALWNVTVCKGANSNLCLYLALFFRGTGSAFSGTLANTRLVKSAGGFPPALFFLRNLWGNAFNPCFL